MEKKKLVLTFLGGVEENVGTRSMKIEVPTDIRKMTQLIRYLYEEILKENPGREALLCDDMTVKPGILVLHNNRDINLFDVSFLISKQVLMYYFLASCRR